MGSSAGAAIARRRANGRGVQNVTWREGSRSAGDAVISTTHSAHAGCDPDSRRKCKSMSDQTAIRYWLKAGNLLMDHENDLKVNDTRLDKDDSDGTGVVDSIYNMMFNSQHIHVVQRQWRGLASAARTVVDNLCVQREADISMDDLHHSVKTWVTIDHRGYYRECATRGSGSKRR